MRVRALVPVLTLMCICNRVDAHQGTVFYGDVAVRGATVRLTLQLPDNAIAAALRSGDVDAVLSREEALASADRLAQRLAETVIVDGDGHRCRAPERADEARLADKADGFFLVVSAVWDCEHAVSTVRLTDSLFFDVDARHELLLRVLVPGEPPASEIVRSTRRTLTITRTVGWVERALDGVRLGIAHIFTGYDHLAFLFALLAAARLASLRRGLVDVARVVTAFTVAHSITLVAAGLDLVRLPSRIVEPAIALSIAAVAATNLFRTLRRPDADGDDASTATARRQAVVAFVFGLVHGFGFASVLRELELPREGLVATLLAFNVGVEIGQLAIVAVVAPALALAARGQTQRPLVAAAIVALAAVLALILVAAGLGRMQVILAVGGGALALVALVPRLGYTRAIGAGSALVLLPLSLFWFVERVLERSLLGGALG
jgi:hypothetical protein